MRTTDARAIRRMLQVDPLGELSPSDPSETLMALRPVIDRIRRGDWRLEVAGPQTAADADGLALLQVRLFEAGGCT
jgi:hypothetical protein